jgi:hypothetical protein
MALCSLECGSIRGCNLALKATTDCVRDPADTQPRDSVLYRHSADNTSASYAASTPSPREAMGPSTDGHDHDGALYPAGRRNSASRVMNTAHAALKESPW